MLIQTISAMAILFSSIYLAQDVCHESVQTKATKDLDHTTADFLEGFSKVFVSIAHLPIAEQRAVIKQIFLIPQDQLEHVAKVEDKTVPGRHGSIPIRLYSPKSGSPLSVIVYLHRGGWVYGSIEESEMICRKLANETGAIVAAVEYRLAPEHKFPIPLEDCYDATKWIVENASTFSGNPNKIIICGESAGGNLAAAVALMAREKKQFTLASQLLIYPILTSDLHQKNYDNSPDKKLLSIDSMRFFLSAYLSSPDDGKNPYVSPLKSKNFSQLPPCFIISAEHDALKHEGSTYAEFLRKAKVAVQSKCYLNVIHGFLDLPLADATKQEAIEDIKAWVKSF